jgi:hypothetical protein
VHDSCSGDGAAAAAASVLVRLAWDTVSAPPSKYNCDNGSSNSTHVHAFRPRHRRVTKLVE